jgi:Tol biopolymer transport system component
MRVFVSTIILVFLSLGLFGQEITVNKIEIINTNNNPAFYPQFSPDGNKLYYTSANYSGIWEYNINNYKNSQINNYIGAGMSPVFTNDGNAIVFRKDEYKNRRKHSSIVAYNFKSKSEIILEADNRYLTLPVKSTNGSIVYKKKNKFQIFSQDLKSKINNFNGKLIDANNDNLILYEDSNPITLNFSEDSQYLWASLSADQSKMLFTKAGEGTYVSDLKGNVLVELGYGNAPVWSPDGKWIAYMVDKDDGHQFTKSDIYIVSEDGQSKYKVTESEHEIEMYPQWSPDGIKIVFNTIDGIIKIAHLEFE